MTEKIFFFALFLFSIGIWVLLNGRPGKYDLRTRFDEATPFIPQFVFVYLAAYGMVGASCVVLFFSPFAQEYFFALSVAMYTAALSWYFLPAKSYNPGIVLAGRKFTTLVVSMNGDNPHGNAFPSAHVMTSVITAYFLCLAYPALWVLFCLAAFLVALSTLFIRQHHLFDVLAGVVWAAAAVSFALYIF